MVAWAVQAGPIPVLRSQEKESVLIRVLNRDRHTKKKGGLEIQPPLACCSTRIAFSNAGRLSDKL